MAKKKLSPDDFTRFATPVSTEPGQPSGLIDRSRFGGAARETPSAQDEESGAVVGEYPIAQILPDPFQGRGGLLPVELEIPVYNRKLTPSEALERWLSDLDESSVYWKRYISLRELADSIAREGLINPIHIYRPAASGAEPFGAYMLESGERRYWAFWLLSREQPEVYARVRAIVESNFSLSRQIDENEDIATLSPVGQARNIARAYLTTLGVTPPLTGEISPQALYEYFRQAARPVSELIGQGRLPDGFWEGIEKLVKKNRVSILERLAVFGLPRGALELADAAGLNFLQLKEIVACRSSEAQEDLTTLAASYDLTGADLRKLAALAEADPAAYRRAVQEFRAERAAVPEMTARRRQGTPVEVQARRLVQTVRGIERIGDQEYRAVAEKILHDRPAEAESIAAVLEKLAQELRRGIK